MNVTTLALSTPAVGRARPLAESSLALGPGSDSGADDRRLAAAARKGDQEAFGQLVTRYAPVARRVARSVLGNESDADDAAQDGFLSAWSKINQFDPKRPFRPWLMRIVANAATDLYRRRRVRMASDLHERVADDTAGPDLMTDQVLLRERLAEALAGLNERQRMAVTMFDAEGFGHSEIAEVMGVPVGTVRSLVFHARRALREALLPFKGEGI